MKSAGQREMDIDSFRKVRVLVYGDVMLDESLLGIADRISPEAPVPVVHLRSTQYQLGGAANVALNVHRLGGDVLLAGRVGDDETARILRSLLADAGVTCTLLETQVPSTRKTRVIAQSQQLVRVDTESTVDLGEDEPRMIALLENAVADIIVVSDYAKGCVTAGVMDILLAKAPVIVDPKPQNKKLFSGVHLITPNKKECLSMTSDSSLDGALRTLSRELGCSVLVTLGEEGMCLLHDGSVVDIPTRAREVYDVTGAGDTVIAVMALALGSGWPMEQAAHVANAAAGIKVAKHGTVPVEADELRRAIVADPLRVRR